MALILPDLTIPPVAELFPSTRRRRVVKPCGTAAARRRATSAGMSHRTTTAGRGTVGTWRSAE